MTGSYQNEVTLQKTDQQSYKQNRRTMCPPGYCADGVKEYIEFLKENNNGEIPEAAYESLLAASDMSCDEFPFARSAEGGSISAGTRICIPSAENSWQGGVMGSFFKGPDGIQEKEYFNVLIEGIDCAELSNVCKPGGTVEDIPPRKKRDATQNLTGSVVSSDLWTGFAADDSLKMATMPVGDLVAGE